MELLGTAVRRVLQDARSRMDERKTGEANNLPGKVAPGGVARGKDTGRDVGRGSAVASHRRREDRDARLPGGELV